MTLNIGDFVNCTITNTALSASSSLLKQAGTPTDVNQDGITDAGDTIAYTFIVTNTGVLTMSNITVTDNKVGPVTCPQPTLAPGNSETCTANSLYTVTAADDTAGAVANTATASGIPPGGVTPVRSPPSSTSTPTAVPKPALSVVKTANPSTGNSSQLTHGETIAYSYLVTNTGNDNLTSLAVNDPTGGPVTCPTPPAPGLAPGDSETCTANTPYPVTQTDINRGKVVDTATATGTDPNGITSPPSTPSTATVGGVAPAPMVAIDKNAQVTPTADQNAAAVGDTIAYTYVVTNTGNVTLVSVAVSDPTEGPVTCPTPTAPGLAPGASETCTASAAYTVTQADVDTGSIVDTATATGTDTQGNTSPASDPSTVTIETVTPAPAVSIAKTGTVNPAADQDAAQVGDTIAYTYLITNTGNITLTSLAVNDPTGGPVVCPTPTAPGLAPGASETCTAKVPYTVTQADVDTGRVSDTATATGTDTQGNTSPPSDPSTATIKTVPAAPTVSLIKIANASLGNTAGLEVGETIVYSYLVTNTGNVTLTSLAANDPTQGPVTCPVPAAPGLAPGASETCTAATTYTVTAADVSKGSVTDTATATGTDTQGDTSPPSGTSTVVVPSNPAPAVVIHKTGQVTPAADQNAAHVGDTVAYSYLVTNVGNVTLASVTVDDPTLGNVTCPAPALPGLAPGAALTCTAATPYVVTQADVDAGSIVDTATATASDTDGNLSPPSPPSSATIQTVAPAPAVSVIKTGTVTPGSNQDAATLGNTIAYTYQVINTGNVTLTSVSVSDPTIGPVGCPTLAPPGLASGASATCTADTTHTVTQADIDAGSITDTATATGTDTAGNASPTSGPSTVNIAAVAPAPAVSIQKTADASTGDTSTLTVGETISYSYLVTNTGNVALVSIAVDDPTLGAVSCPTPAGSGLQPGGSETCTAVTPHTVTQADVDRGSVTDTATAVGTDANGDTSPPSAPSTVVIPGVAAPKVAIDKTAKVTPAADQNAVKVGDTVAYSYTVTNLGNVSLESVAVSDPTGGPVACPTPAAPGLAPGASQTCTAEHTHQVTQADVNAGKVVDTATAFGTDTQGVRSPTSNPSTATVLAESAEPTVSIRKSATVDPSADQDGAKVGNTIAYSFVVTNTGDVSLKSVAVSDPTGGPVACPTPAARGLAPGASETCTSVHDETVTSAEVTAGRVVNTATASGTDTQGTSGAPSDPSTVVVPAVATATAASATPASASASAATPGSTTTLAPNGLGQIATDLGRWTRSSGPGTWAVFAGIGAAPGAAGLLKLRRRRQPGHVAGDGKSHDVN